MTLLDRLLGTENPKLPVHQFMAGLAEYKRGEITRPQFVSAIGLSGAEDTQLGDWITGLDADTINRADIHDVLLLGETGLYTKAQVRTRLGVGD